MEQEGDEEFSRVKFHFARNIMYGMFNIRLRIYQQTFYIYYFVKMGENIIFILFILFVISYCC